MHQSTAGKVSLQRFKIQTDDSNKKNQKKYCKKNCFNIDKNNIFNYTFDFKVRNVQLQLIYYR